ncbi:MAG: hypothetical protein ACLFSQ_10975 [Candidatus Zixiibacteriota bacterium]
MKIRIIFCFIVLIISIKASTFDLSLEAGWNLVSTPFHSVDRSDWDVIDVFGYNPEEGVYGGADELNSGSGYFVLSLYPQNISISGDIDTCIYHSMEWGWNMGGGPFRNLTPEEYMNYFDPDSFIEPMYNYNPIDKLYHEVDNITPGMGFWILSMADMSADSCIHSAQVGETIWSFAVDSFSHVFQNQCSPAIDKRGNVYFCEHRECSDSICASSGTPAAQNVLYAFSKFGTLLWADTLYDHDRKWWKHNPSPFYFSSGQYYIFIYNSYNSA